MPKTVIIPKGSPAPLAPYSPGIKAGNTIYVSGMLALDKDGGTIGVGDVKAQTRAVLESIKAVIEQAGGSMDDVVFNQIFLKDLGDYKAMNEVYAEYFPKDSARALLHPRRSGARGVSRGDRRHGASRGLTPGGGDRM